MILALKKASSPSLSLSLGLEMLPSSSGSASKCSIRLTRSCSTSLPYEQGDDDGGVCV